MDFLMDYLPAIQFAAALNIGYILPNIMAKMNGVLNNINNGYVKILHDVKSRVILKLAEVNRIGVIETKDNRTNKRYINNLLENLQTLKEGCHEKEKSLTTVINGFVECSGYRSLFFYSALFSVLTLLVIPFCHQHCDEWNYRVFFYILNVMSLIYLLLLSLFVICKRCDVSCRSVFGFFMLFGAVSVIVACINSMIPAVVEVSKETEDMISFIAVVVPFFPGAGCMLFLMMLVYYGVIVAHFYSIQARFQFWRMKHAMNKLNVIDEIFEEDVVIK